MTDNSTTQTTSEDASRIVVAGHYEVDLNDQLGAGGMALVYRGRDLRTRRTVAMKTLRQEYKDDPETRARFRREARTLAFLQHPNVARVYDLYEGGDAPWVVMEFVPGRSLKEEIASKGPFDLDLVAHVLEQIASALSHLHRGGLVHLDVKPQNAIVTPDRIVKLIDFGLAQQAGQAQELIGGVTYGTAAYLAPEQATGEAVDAATDVYSLGCVVYELLTGEPLFESKEKGETKNDLIRKHVEQAPVPPSKRRPDLRLPLWVDDIVLAAVAKKPDDRYGSVEAFASLFREGLEGTVVAGRDVANRVAQAKEIALQPGTHEKPSRASRQPSQLREVGQSIAHSNSFRSWLWKIVALVAAINLVVGVISYAIDGRVPYLIAGDPSLYSGGRAEVAVDRYYLRGAPNRQGDQLAILDVGTQLTITGDKVDADNRTWWPARLVVNGDTLNGYIAEEGLRPLSRKGPAILTDLTDWVKDL